MEVGIGTTGHECSNNMEMGLCHAKEIQEYT